MPRAATAAARTGARVERAPRRPPARRRSGPTRVATTAPGLRVLPLPRFVPSASGLLDRLLRGRVWVVLIGCLLVGIVFFNVGVMRLNQTITRDSARATALRQENSRLGVEAARLGSSERIQRLAAARGFVLPLPKDVRYLTVSPKDSIRASHRIVPPQPAVSPGPISQTPQTTMAPATPTAPTTTTPSGATGASGTTAPASGVPAGGAPVGTSGPTYSTPTNSTPTDNTPTSTTPTGGATAGGGGAP
jgi:cell division protein FtsL